MKRTFIAVACALLSSSAFADTSATMTQNKAMRVGLDFAMPYIVTVDGNSAKTRGNFNLGLDGRYWLNDNVNLGARMFFDVEKRGTARQIGLAPGAQYRWMPNESFNPYVRADLPVVFRGAAATTNNKQDVGISTGAGIAWNLGEAIGIENMAIRYDFNFQYYFGLGSALPVFAIEPFKIGFDYRF